MEYVSLKDVQFPLRVRLRANVWPPAFVMAVVLWVLFVPIILGPPPSLFELFEELRTRARGETPEEPTVHG
ncbi:hypothetical protein HMPREF3162_01200 [Brevibacterium sp. HMSC07C04]|nr:hypothetical protein HMPREF3162_01200 [Brevibacterium sp. HMSC07C04]